MNQRGADATLKELCNAALRGDVETVRQMLQNGAATDLPKGVGTLNERGRHSPLLMAAWKGHTEIACLLMEHGADMRVLNSEGEPLLKIAGFEGHSDTMRLLLDWGADVNEQSGYFATTALFEAVGDGHIDVVRLLLERGADVNISDSEGNTILDALRNSQPPNAQVIYNLLTQSGASE